MHFSSKQENVGLNGSNFADLDYYLDSVYLMKSWTLVMNILFF